MNDMLSENRIPMTATVKEKLQSLADEKYRAFISGLLPNVDNIMGVRLPALRKVAREIAGGDWRGFLEENPAYSESLEEIMLQGMVLGCVKADIEELLRYVAGFVPKIDNWSVCDSFCMGLKIVKRHKDRVWDFLQPYFISREEFELRFGIVMLLSYYIDDRYIGHVLAILDSIKHEGYYVKMAVAWTISVCFVKQPEPTMKFLQSNTLDDFTYNKALQKITESYRVDAETKAVIRSMKRKESKI